MLIDSTTNFNKFLPTGIHSSSTVTYILNKCFIETNAGNNILDFYTKNYNIINITNGTTAGKYGNFFITWHCTDIGQSISGYQQHLTFIRLCSSSNIFTRLLKILMNFKKYNNKHANLLQTNKDSRCYGVRGTSNSITIGSFVDYYGDNVLG
jgi:hypothetical protein